MSGEEIEHRAQKTRSRIVALVNGLAPRVVAILLLSPGCLLSGMLIRLIPSVGYPDVIFLAFGITIAFTSVLLLDLSTYPFADTSWFRLLTFSAVGFDYGLWVLCSAIVGALRGTRYFWPAGGVLVIAVLTFVFLFDRKERKRRRTITW